MPDPSSDNIKQQYLKELYQDYKYSINKFDSQTLFLSSGALGISLVFLKDLVPLGEVIYLWIYILAIWIFVFNILLGLWTHFRSSNLITKRIKLVDEDRFNEIKEDNSIHKFNKALIALLFSGIFFLVLFVTINLINMDDKKQSLHTGNDKTSIDKPIIEKGLPLKPLPSNINTSTSTSSGSATDNTAGSSNSSDSSKK